MKQTDSSRGQQLNRSKKSGNQSAKKSESKTLSAAEKELARSKLPFKEWDFISPAVKRGIQYCGYTEPTPVQSAVVEPALEGRHLIVQSKTGTGKTAAFGIPLIEKLTPRRKTPQAIVLTPTRELAAQVAEELKKINKYKGLKIVTIYGGLSFQDQLEALERGADIAVGTPGRILDHIRRKTLDTSDVKVVVLDEADEMLSMGFFLEVSNIIDKTPSDRQLLLFSATIPPDIEGLIRQFTQDPLRLMISGDDRRVEGIGHALYIADENLPRPRNLLYIIEYERPSSAMIFCNRRDDTELLAAYLQRYGKKARAIHGEMAQTEREKILKEFKEGKIQFLIATDVAARGIDISNLKYVINYNFPPNVDVYFHRVGRTGRKGEKGIAISIISGEEINKVVQIKHNHKIFFDLRELPPLNDLVSMASNEYISKLFDAAILDKFEPYLPLADLLQEDPRGRFIVAYLLKLYQEGNLTPKADGESPDGKSELRRKLESYGSKVIRLRITVGAKEGYNSENLKKMLSEEADVPIKKLGAVQIEDHYSFIFAELDAAEKILAKIQDRKVNGIYINATVDQRKRR